MAEIGPTQILPTTSALERWQTRTGRTSELGRVPVTSPKDRHQRPLTQRSPVSVSIQLPQSLQLGMIGATGNVARR